MNKKISFFTLLIALIILAQSPDTSSMEKEGELDIIDKIKLLKNDIPKGFIFGKIPDYAKKVFKRNPWVMDRNAIKKLATEIYPGGDYSKISEIHVTIITKKVAPYGDDIVCYIIIYKDSASANAEIKKITKFAEYNKDRVLLNTKNNLAVYLHVDDVNNFHLIQEINQKIKERLKNI